LLNFSRDVPHTKLIDMVVYFWCVYLQYLHYGFGSWIADLR